MKFQTLSVIAGTEICNARCPFCVACMTGMDGITKKQVKINDRNLAKAYNLAWRSGVNTVIITGKGEPTIYPEHIDHYLSKASDNFQFPFMELQTNGSLIGNESRHRVNGNRLNEWYDMGLTTILLSITHYNDDKNHKIYFPQRDGYIDIEYLAGFIHGSGINIRLCCVGIKDHIDNADELQKFAEFAKKLNIQQITWRPVAMPEESADDQISNWVRENPVSRAGIEDIRLHVEENGELVRNLPHGAKVYDYGGQNLCISNCLTHSPDSEDQRQLIFYPDGKLTTDWSMKGSILL